MHEYVINNLINLNKELGYSGFVMAQNNINKILNYIANTSALKNLLERTNIVVDYNALYKDAVADANKFKLPNNNEGIFVLITGLMHGFLCGKIDYVKFLQTRFAGNTIDYSFKAFYDKVMQPYFLAISSLLVKSEKQLNIDIKDIEVSVPKIAIEQLLNILNELNRAIKNDASLNSQKSIEYLELLQGMEIALADNKTKYVKLIWYALKNILVAKSYTSLIKALETVLTNYSII